MKPSIRLKQKGWQNLFYAKKIIGISTILKNCFLKRLDNIGHSVSLCLLSTKNLQVNLNLLRVCELGGYLQALEMVHGCEKVV